MTETVKVGDSVRLSYNAIEHPGVRGEVTAIRLEDGLYPMIQVQITTVTWVPIDQVEK